LEAWNVHCRSPRATPLRIAAPPRRKAETFRWSALIMKKLHSGFTLVELMITVAVLAILAAIAWPSYQEYVRKSRRAEAQAFLMAVAARQQQFLVDTRGYTASLTDIGVPTPTNVTATYDIALAAPAGNPPAFSVTATPKAGQVGERCGTLSIDQIGTKTAATSGCW
jgi:type IV pilus assembly protein PilE